VPTKAVRGTPHANVPMVEIVIEHCRRDP